MASSANKNSSFSPPIPNRPNPKPRNSEVGDPLRRSFGGNPFPTANTRVDIPSDFSRRNSFGSDKENETKAVPTPKGSKNFMSPTISAVSKINASPRKRVLSDKNEVMSRSFSDVKGLTLEDNKGGDHRAKSCVSFSDVIHNICIDEKNQLEESLLSHDMTVTDFDDKEVFENKGVTYSDPRFRISPRPSVPYSSPEFPAREVDTLLPPYDPKKNFLSPRPQFLHYKPNPRIEKRSDECKQLEELFICEESSSDTESSAEASENEAETEDVEELEAESDEEMGCESIEETSQVPKQSGFRKLKLLGWFLALAMAYLLVSATFSAPTESTLYEFYIPREITEFAKDNNLEKLSEKLWTLTESSLAYMDTLISRLGGGNEEYVQLQFQNLTYTLEDNTVFQPTSVEIDEEPLQEKSRVETILEDVYGEDGSVNASKQENGGEEKTDGQVETNEVETEMRWNTDIELNEVAGNLKALLEDSFETEQRECEVSPEEKLETGSFIKDQEKLEEAEYEIESAAINVQQQDESETVVAESVSEESFGDIAAETSNDLCLEVRSDNDFESEQEEAVGETAAEASDELHLKVRSDTDSAKLMVIVLSSTVLVLLLAAVAFLFVKKAKPLAVSTLPEPAIETIKKLNLDNNFVMKEKLSSLNFEAEEEVDDTMSNSFHNKKKNNSSNKLRRESFASSASEYSVGSFSYGSFTTYEKIPIKSGDKEEEMITPVRRSSRIRNKPSGL